MGNVTGERHGDTARANAMRERRPNGLMQRLAELDAAAGLPAPAAPVGYAPRRLCTSFVLGLLASVGIGGVAHFALFSTGQMAGAARSPPAALASALPDRRRQIVLDMPIVRSEAPTSFPLLVTDLDAASDARIVLQDLPEAVTFSHGERRDEHTWELQTRDLDDLQMMPHASLPATFSFNVEVVAYATVLAHASALVRLVDRPAIAEQPARRPQLAEGSWLQRAPATVAKPNLAALDWSTSTRTKQFVSRQALAGTSGRAADLPSAVAQAAAPGNRTPLPPTLERPQGMSALGALQRKAADEGRRLWWTMPLPTWAPFGGGEGEPAR
jgi:hypothetical protein